MTSDSNSAGVITQTRHSVSVGAGDASAVPAVPDDLDALRAVVEGTAAGIGREFFKSLVRHLAAAIGVPYAAVCEFDTPPDGRVLAFWERDHVVEDLTFQFTTSPAAEVLHGRVAHFPMGVLRQFPRAAFLVERDIEGYMAVPLQAADGTVLGLISVFDRRPMPEEPRRLFILRIFAARATAELLRLRAEQGLVESEARYRDLFDNAPNAYWLVDTDGRVLHANRRAAELLGRPLEEMVGSLTPSFGADTPEGKPRIMEVRRKHLAGEAVSGWELELRRKDGRPAWIKVWMEPGRGADGSIGTARAFGVDITDRVLAERERARLQQQNLYLQEEIKSEHNFEQIVGRSPALSKVLAEVGRVAATDATVLISGETGTGKELIARAVHSASKRRDKPLIKVNCAALPAGLVESELFGHEKGAFSGAVARRLGRFELADGGTIFLDEVGELPLDAQAKLLRALQEREFDRVGGAAPVKVDVRVIAATNRDLATEVRERRFREDLHYRLNVFPVRLPPLRERQDDIPLLVHFLLDKFAPRVGKPLEGVSRATIQRLQEYSWPGNVRELENVLERAIILATGPTLDIGADLLPSAARSPRGGGRPGLEEMPTSHIAPVLDQPPRLEVVERDHILAVLRQTNWLITGPRGAAKLLGLHSNTLRNRMKKLGITRPAH
ncbi:MAG TPA: sigma 54-interacting transcriptional regulator [Gemmataceae bacterium]|nr:sigma 54-interacting transcriptional regulator [Gemmataceae bacterium]